MRKSFVSLALLVSLTACEYNLGPSVNVNNTNTNTNTNTIDLHDLVNFVPVPNPTAPVPSPTTGGTETPLAIPNGSQLIAQAYATANPTQIAKSCQAVYGESAWAFMDGMVKTLAATDPRWGYLVKSNTGQISADVIAYRSTSDNTGAWGIDIIVDLCGPVSSFAWGVIGMDPNAQWSGTRF